MTVQKSSRPFAFRPEYLGFAALTATLPIYRARTALLSHHRPTDL